MVPKIRAALAGITAPGAEAIICDGSAPNALERALSDGSFGTRISAAAAKPGVAAGTTPGAPATTGRS